MSTSSYFRNRHTSKSCDLSLVGAFGCWPSLAAFNCARMEGFSCCACRALICNSLGFSPERGRRNEMRSTTQKVLSFNWRCHAPALGDQRKLFSFRMLRVASSGLPSKKTCRRLASRLISTVPPSNSQPTKTFSRWRVNCSMRLRTCRIVALLLDNCQGKKGLLPPPPAMPDWNASMLFWER